MGSLYKITASASEMQLGTQPPRSLADIKAPKTQQPADQSSNLAAPYFNLHVDQKRRPTVLRAPHRGRVAPNRSALVGN